MARRQPTMFRSEVWEGELAVCSRPETAARRFVLLKRKGGVPLQPWERFLIRHALRFRKADRRDDDLPTTSDFLEGLIDKMVAQIDRAAMTSFSVAYDEATRFHTFILAAQNTRDESGRAINLAEIGGTWTRPDVEWVRAYRRAYDAAADKLSVNTDFIKRLAYLPYKLLPSDSTTFSRPPLVALVDLGPFLVIALEAWLTRHTQPAYNPLGDATARLAGSDARAYEEVLIDFVGAWEAFQSRIIRSTGLRKMKQVPQGEQWRRYGAAWPILFAHMKASAYFVALAVWNEDDPGEARYRDHLLRWRSHLYEELGSSHVFRRTYQLIPGLFEGTWGEAVDYVRPMLRFASVEQPTPSSVFGEILRANHRDVVTIVAALSLSWYTAEQQATNIGARAAVALMRREVLDEGTDLTAMTGVGDAPFRAGLDLLIRRVLAPQGKRGLYSASLDDLVRELGSVASSRMVPGRVYSGGGFEGIDTLTEALFAIMAAHLPTDLTDLPHEVASWAANGGPISEPETLRAAIDNFHRLAERLGPTADPSFARATRAFGAEIDVAAAHGALKGLFGALAEALREQELRALRAGELDQAAIAALRQRVSQTLLSEGPDLAVFREAAISRAEPREALLKARYGRIDKGAYLRPPISPISRDDLDEIITEAVRDKLADKVWQAFHRLPRQRVTFRHASNTADFWRMMGEQAAHITGPRVAFAPHTYADPVGAAAFGLVDHGLKDFAIELASGQRGGRGLAYVGTINDIDVYVWDESDRALLFSPRILKTIDYAPVGPNGEVFDFKFVDDEIPSESQIEWRCSQEMTWGAGTIVEVAILNLEDEADSN